MRHFATVTANELLAEGVGTEQEAQTLRSPGVTLAQGYLFGRPGRLPDIDVEASPTTS